MSWVTLDRIVSKEALSDEAILRQLEQNARPLRSHTARMGDEDLLAKLRGLGVDADREKLAKLCRGALSAEEVVSDRPARRGPGTPAAGGTGTAARRAASTARHGLGGERPGRRAAHREAAPGR